MLTIESLTTSQMLSPVAYMRLRESLMCQGHLFDEVVTEADWARQSDRAIATVRQVAMRSQDLLKEHSAKSRSVAPLDEAASDEALEMADWQQDAEQFVLMVADSWCLLFVARMATDRKSARTYQVKLTFDSWAIAQFASCLEDAAQNSKQLEHLLEDRKTVDTDALSDRALHAHSVDSLSHLPFSPESYFSASQHRSGSAKKKSIAKEAFMLSWAKQIATSPESAAQRNVAVLQSQTQRSLLLDQVVTKIRHSLDLPDILETTVAQVRAFLGADRLVLYQFDNSVREERDSKSLAARRALQVESKDKDRRGAGAIASDDSCMQPGTRVGHSVVSGNVTYEARASESVKSVLHSAEEKCFTPSRLHRARFLSGQPIAVNNVDRQYARTACLLEFLKNAQVKSKLIAPVVVNGDLWGLLIAHQCDDYRQWKKTEVVFLRHIAEHLAVAVSQAQLYHQVQEQATSLESRVAQRTQNLRDALMVAETASVTKGEFLSTMSHELRTPLTYIIGMSATLLRWSFGELSDRQRSYLNTINQSGEQLLEIINNILELAKVESGQRFLEVSELSLSEVLESTLARYEAFARSHGVVLAKDSKLTAEEDLFWADKKRLQQVMANLTENAIKFTPEGGQVKLMVWREPQQMVFQVEDSGIGIAESQRDGLFEKFKQLESPFARQYSGTGIGLAMTKHLVEMHGGSIHVESEVGSGSTFTVCLPMQPQPLHSVREDISDAFASAKRIVLLEKDEESAAIICNMLTAAGYEVIWLLEAESLSTQIELLKPMMLIADLSMLKLEARQVKSLQFLIAKLDTKVLALSASQTVSSLVAHHDVLTKPIEPKTLLEKARQLSSVGL